MPKYVIFACAFFTASCLFSQEDADFVTQAAFGPDTPPTENVQAASAALFQEQPQNASNPFPWLKVTQGTTRLPKNDNQVWIEYDITPFTKPRAQTSQNAAAPQRLIVDWILRATPKDAWHNEPFSILSADAEKLYVYHTPEMQRVVAEIVARFVNPNTDKETFAIRIVSVNNPNWRSRINGVLKPVGISSPGVQGSLLSRDDAGRVFSELSRRGDFKEYCPPSSFFNGQPISAASRVPKQFTENIQSITQGYTSNFTPQTAVVNEGYSFSLLTLMDSDQKTAYLMFKCDLLQIEKMHPVVIDAPTSSSPKNRLEIESPQLVEINIDEHIRWPKEDILLLDLGMIPMPSVQQKTEPSVLTSLSRLANTDSNRANVLLFIEWRGVPKTQEKPANVAIVPEKKEQQQQPAVPAVQPLPVAPPTAASLFTPSAEQNQRPKDPLRKRF